MIYYDKRQGTINYFPGPYINHPPKNVTIFENGEIYQNCLTNNLVKQSFHCLTYFLFLFYTIFRIVKQFFYLIISFDKKNLFYKQFFYFIKNFFII